VRERDGKRKKKHIIFIISNSKIIMTRLLLLYKTQQKNFSQNILYFDNLAIFKPVWKMNLTSSAF
jgi:hypothetical protein